MQVLRNYPYLTGLLALLLVLKFLLVPLIQWQNETLWSIKQNHKRLSHAATAAVNMSANQRQLSQLQQQLKQIQAVFYPQLKEASFKLEQQQLLESLLAEHHFNVSNIGWTYSAQVLGQPLIKHQLSVSFDGDTFDLPSLYLTLDRNPQWIDVMSFSFNLMGQNEKSLGRFRGSLDLVFYQLAGNEHNVEQGQSNE
jgi:hypothetical protein